MTPPWVGGRPRGSRPPDPVVLVLGGFLTSPPAYRRARPAPPRPRCRRRRRRRTSGRWTGCSRRRAASGPILTRSGRALLEASRRSEAGWPAGRPVLVVGHSAGGMSARLLTSPVPFAGRRLDAARGGSGRSSRSGRRTSWRRDAGTRGRVGAEAAAFANRVVPGPRFAPRHRLPRGRLAARHRPAPGAPRGERRTWERLPAAGCPGRGCDEIVGDGLIPLASALLPGRAAARARRCRARPGPGSRLVRVAAARRALVAA